MFKRRWQVQALALDEHPLGAVRGKYRFLWMAEREARIMNTRSAGRRFYWAVIDRKDYDR